MVKKAVYNLIGNVVDHGLFLLARIRRNTGMAVRGTGSLERSRLQL
ncbi:hypothetical protein [Methanoculleus sp.]|nr:hypothetical protein [Methanoculleus sp.]